MTRGEAPGGSRPGVFDAIRPAGGWMGGSLQPLLAGALTPHPHGLTGGAQQKPVGNRQPAPFMGLAGGVHGRGDGENSASLIFLALPRSACPRFWANFLTLSPPYGWG